MDDPSHAPVLPVPSSSYGLVHDTPTGRRASAIRPFGVLLVVLGLLADSGAGLMILVHHDVRGLLVHVPAALGWALGISVLNGRLPWRAPGLAFGVRSLAFGSSAAHTPKAEGRRPNAERHATHDGPAYLSRRMVTALRLPRRAPVGAHDIRPLAQAAYGAVDQRASRPACAASRAYLNRWMVTSVLLGLVLFPGLGPLGCTCAFGLSYLLAKGSRHAPGACAHLDAPDLEDPADRPLCLDPPTDPLRDLQVQPVVDLLRQPDSTLKRAAIAALGRRGGREAMRLVRGALTDPDPDVRSDAAVTLSRLEDDFNRALSQAMAQGLDSPDSAARYADLCYRYATSDLLDAATSRYYLAQARDTLRRITALQPARAEVWMDLARVQHDLGDTMAAWQALDRARTLCPDNVASYRLGMQMAFEARDWDRLLTYARQGRLAVGADDEDRDLLTWWAHAHPLLARRADRSIT